VSLKVRLDRLEKAAQTRSTHFSEACLCFPADEQPMVQVASRSRRGCSAPFTASVFSMCRDIISIRHYPSTLRTSSTDGPAGHDNTKRP
jgi:hypothetical protein